MIAGQSFGLSKDEAVLPLGIDKWPIVGHFFYMAFALAKEQKQFIDRMIRKGRFNSQSEVVREALRRLEDSESDYLNPPPLTSAQVENIYGRNGKSDSRERRFGRAAFASLHAL
jgi:putative addiction module CopG family antidote